MHISQIIRQKSYEHIELVLRRHYLTFIPRVVLFLTLLLIPVAVFFMLNTLFPALFRLSVLYALAILLGSMYYLTIYAFFYGHFIIHYLDLWIVTNDRIVDIEQLGLFSRTISELDLFHIQDVTTEVKGVFATFFDYGDVHVTTASINANIIFYSIPHPDQVRHTLLRLAESDRKFHNGHNV